MFKSARNQRLAALALFLGSMLMVYVANVVAGYIGFFIGPISPWEKVYFFYFSLVVIGAFGLSGVAVELIGPTVDFFTKEATKKDAWLSMLASLLLGVGCGAFLICGFSTVVKPGLVSKDTFDWLLVFAKVAASFSVALMLMAVVTFDKVMHLLTSWTTRK